MRRWCVWKRPRHPALNKSADEHRDRSRTDGGVIDRCLDRVLAILEDEKPTAVRQALAALLELAPYKRALWPVIRARVEAMDLNRYRDTMAPLIEKDIRRLLDAME